MTTYPANLRSALAAAMFLALAGMWAAVHAEEAAKTAEARPRSTPRVDRSVMEYRSTLRVYEVDIDSRFRPVGSSEPDIALPDIDYRTTPTMPADPSITDLPPPRMPVRRPQDPDPEDGEESGWGWLAAEVAQAREAAQSETEQEDADEDDRLREEALLQGERNLFEEDQQVFRQNNGFFISAELEASPTVSPDGSWSLEEGADLITNETGIDDDRSSPVVSLPDSLRDDPIARLFRLDAGRDSVPLTFADTPSRVAEDRFRPPDSPAMATRTLTGENAAQSRFIPPTTALWASGQWGEDDDLTQGYQPGMFEAQDAQDEGFRVGSSPFDSVLGVGAASDRSGAVGIPSSRTGSGLAPAGAGGEQGLGLSPVTPASRTGFGQTGSSSSGFDDSIRQPSALPW